MFDIDNYFVGVFPSEFGFVRLKDFLDSVRQFNPKNPPIQHGATFRNPNSHKKGTDKPYRKTPSKNAKTSSFVGCFKGRTTRNPTKGESAFHHLLFGI